MNVVNADTGRVHIVVDNTRESFVILACGIKLPRRKVWQGQHLAVSCKRCARRKLP